MRNFDSRILTLQRQQRICNIVFKRSSRLFNQKQAKFIKWHNYKAKEYFITSELAEDSGTKIAPIGTVCHEYGHQLGAPDYYCPNYTYPGTGRWDVMCTGSRNGFNIDGRCPAHHNPYTKAYVFDWVTPTVINSSVSNATYTLTPIHNTTSIYRINTSTNNEFFLLENKQSVINTFNYWIPDRSGGLLIYHIHSDIENAIKKCKKMLVFQTN